MNAISLPSHADVLALATRWRNIIASYYGWDTDPGESLTPEHLATCVAFNVRYTESGTLTMSFALQCLEQNEDTILYSPTWKGLLEKFTELEHQPWARRRS